MKNFSQNLQKVRVNTIPDSSELDIHHYLPLERFRQLVANGLYVRSAFNFEDKNDCRIPFCAQSDNSLACAECEIPLRRIDTKLVEQIKRFDGNICGVFGILKFYINEKLNLALSRSRESVFTDNYVYDLADCFSGLLKKDSELKNMHPVVIQRLCELSTEIEKEKYRCSFISSWTDSAPENPNSKGWDLHAKENGVCISSTVKRLTSAFSASKLEIEGVARVIYFDDYKCKFDEQKASPTLLFTDFIDDWLFIKDKEYSGECEIRFYLHPVFPHSYFDLCMGNIRDHRYVPLKGAITKVTASPTCTSAAKAEIELLTKEFLNCSFATLGKTLNPPLWSHWKD